jgi:hypothetical protein
MAQKAVDGRDDRARPERGFRGLSQRRGSRSATGATAKAGVGASSGIRVRPRGGSGFRAGLRLGAKALLLALLGALAGSATVFSAYSPFGLVAVALATLCLNIADTMPVVAGALVGAAAGGGPQGVIALAVSTAILLMLRRQMRRHANAWTLAGIVAAASAAGSVAAGMIAGGGASIGAYSLTSAALSGAAAAVVLPSANAPVVDGPAALAALAIGCAGLARFGYLGASGGVVAGLYSCAVGGLAAGPAASALAGAAAGLGVGVASASSGTLVATLALGGAAAAASCRHGKAMVGFALMGVSAVCGYFFNAPSAYTARLVEAAIAAAAVVLTPEGVLSALSRKIPQPIYGGSWARAGGDVHHVAVVDLAPVSSVLTGLAREYRGETASPAGGGAGADADIELQGGTGSEDDDPSALMAAAVAAMRDKACTRCGKYDACWTKLFVRTYREFVDVLAMAELYIDADETYLPGGLAERCTRQSRLLGAARELVNGAHEGLAGPGSHDPVGVGAADALPVNREVAAHMLAGQLEAIARMLDGLQGPHTNRRAARGGGAAGASVSAGVSASVAPGATATARAAVDAGAAARSSEAWVEQEIGRRLAEYGITVESVKADLRHARGGAEVQVLKAACANSRECVSILCPTVSAVLGQRVAVWEADCAYDAGSELCRVRMRARTAFTIDIGSVSAPRTNGQPCGDTTARIDMGGGATAVLICDGMGVGDVAAAQSQRAVERLGRMLLAGIPPAYAATVVNDLMFLGADTERFTTIDMLVFGAYDGRADIIKAGAPMSYLRRGGRGGSVTSLGGPSVPAGVAAPARAFSSSVQLRAGDEVYMVTDGVLEAVEDDALLKFISSLDAEDAQEAAEAVALWAQGLADQQHEGARARPKPAVKPPAASARGSSARGGSAAIAVSRMAGLTRADPEPEAVPVPLRDDMTVVVIKIEHEDGVKV